MVNSVSPPPLSCFSSDGVGRAGMEDIALMFYVE